MTMVFNVFHNDGQEMQSHSVQRTLFLHFSFTRLFAKRFSYNVTHTPEKLRECKPIFVTT